MQIIVDTTKDGPETLRLAASVLLTLSGDIKDDSAPDDLKSFPMPVPAPPAAPAATATGTAANTAGASDAANTSQTIPQPPTAPVPASNVVNFPVPPPPPSTAAGTAVPASTGASPAASAAAAPAAASAAPLEYDAAGVPWDARIHQKAKGKKKDNTWKLIKGIDPKIVEQVMRELSAAKLPANAAPAGVTVGTVPPAPAAVAPPVPLPPTDAATAGAGSVPVPPPPSNATPVGSVPAQDVPASVPVPPAPAVGAVPAAPGTPGAPGPYRVLIDKITEATKAQKMTAQQVLAVVTGAGAPNLMMLGKPEYAHLIDAVSTGIDLALAGLA